MKAREKNIIAVTAILSKNGKVKREDCIPIGLAQATWDAFERGFLKARELECESINWLVLNKDFLSIRAIEQYLEMPDSTLIKAVNGSQNLPKKYEERLSEFLMGLQNPQSVGKNCI